MNKFICLTLLLAAVFAHDFTTDEGVVVLTTSNFDHALSEFDFALVEFYAPWCGHCKRLAPEYAKAAQELASSHPNIKLCKVDSTEEKDLGGRYGVRGFPTLKFFIKGSSAPIEYEGGRTHPEIVAWLKKRTGPLSTEVTSASEIEKYISDNELVGVFFGSSDSKAYSDYITVAGSHDDIVFLHSGSDSIRKHFDAEHEWFVLYKKFDEGKNIFRGPWSGVDIKNFVNAYKFPVVMPFNDKTAQKIFGESKDTLFLLINDNEAGKKAEKTFREAAEALKGKITLSYAHIHEGMGSRLAEYIGVTDSNVPAIRIVQPSQDMNKYEFEGEITVHNIQSFFEDFQSGRLKAYFKSEPIPEHNNDPVKVLVGKNFDDIVTNSDNDVLVEFYAPWCGHCKSLVPIWDGLAKKYQHVKGLTIAKMDATANEVRGVNVRGFPTIKFYPRNHKQSPIEFEGDRTEEGFIAFLKEHSSAKLDGDHGHDHHGHDHHGHDHHHKKDDEL
jgi:protein disulfide-isomerase A1